MLSRQLARAATAPATATPRTAVRAFSSSLAQNKTSALSDIEPEHVETFKRKQKAFREQMVEAQKQREASVSISSQSPAPPESSSSVLGSFSTAKGKIQEATTNEPPRKPGPLTNLIYGTKEGREMDAQLEASFSQVLARGKYVHSIVFHTVKQDKVDEYVDLVGQWYPRIAAMPENKVHLVGSWRTEVGDCDTFGKPLP